MQEFDEIRDYAESVLSEKRFLHTLSVANEARGLAVIWGADPQKAYLAGLIHDIAKEIPFEKSMEMLADAGLTKKFKQMLTEPLVHGPLAAHIAKEKLGICDEEVLDAVRYHSTGRLGMSLLEKIIYVADFIEPRRPYQDSKDVGKLAREDLDAAILMQTERCIKFIIDSGKVLNTQTVDVRNSFLTNRKRG